MNVRDSSTPPPTTNIHIFNFIVYAVFVRRSYSFEVIVYISINFRIAIGRKQDNYYCTF
jgi:hypothetical protein